MKRIYQLLILIILLLGCNLPVNADMGPKSAVMIDFECNEDTYYVTLLTDYSQHGPYKEYETSDSQDNQIVEKFKEFALEDDFYLVGSIDQLSQNDTYRWSYIAPETFKILIYFPETDTFICSEIIHRYAYQSTYQLILDPASNQFDLIQNYNYSGLLVSFVFCLSMTLFIEIMMGLSFGYRTRQDLKIIILVNTFTQIVLHSFVHFTLYKQDSFTAASYYLIAEGIIFVAEAIIYRQTLHTKNHPVLYSFLSNALSFLIGVFLVILAGFSIY